MRSIPTCAVGHGQCYLVVSDLIKDDERGLAHVRGDGRMPTNRLEALQRQKSCPEGALLLTEEAQD